MEKSAFLSKDKSPFLREEKHQQEAKTKRYLLQHRILFRKNATKPKAQPLYTGEKAPTKMTCLTCFDVLLDTDLGKQCDMPKWPNVPC